MDQVILEKRLVLTTNLFNKPLTTNSSISYLEPPIRRSKQWVLLARFSMTFHGLIMIAVGLIGFLAPVL